MNIIETTKEMFKNQSFSDYDIEDFVEILTKADDLYHNDEESFLSDNEYDFLHIYAEKEDPSNVYFTGIGSDIRGGKVKLPFTMGSLDQKYEGEMPEWVKKHNLEEESIILTDKLDGTSCMVIYNEQGKIQIGYSRGNGVEGADITRHLRKMRSVPNKINRSIVVRGENIIEQATFPFLCEEVQRKSGKLYKNPRNAASGFMNSKTNNPIVYDYIKFVAYEIVGGTGSKAEQLLELEELGFEVPYSLAILGKNATDENLTKHLNLRRQDSIYEIDGLVLDVNKNTKRKEMNPTRDTLNPAYSIKYKVADVDNVAIVKVIGINWNISKHGYLKPRVNIEAVELGGVTVKWATGFNAAFILNNGIGIDTIVQITRSGDVIPYLQKVITPTIAELPEGEWEWNETNIDAVLINLEDYEEVTIKRTIDFFEKIDAPMLKEGNVQKLYNNEFKTIESIIKASRIDMIGVLGENGNKVFDGLIDKLNNIPLYKIIGAYSNQRGIGIRRMKKLQSALGQDGLYECNDVAVIASVDGFDTKTAKQTVIAINSFIDFYVVTQDFITIAEDEKVGTSLQNMCVCFTGIRDKELAERIEKMGGKVTTSVSKKTTIVVAKDPNSTSGKPKKARELGISIMNIVEFKEMIDGS